MSRELHIEVFGQPAPQGSKRAFINKKTGRAHVIESSHDRVKSWRQAVLEETRSMLAGQPPLTGPLAASITFRMPRPRSHYRTGRNSHLLSDNAPVYPAKTPDLSKLLRSTEDALTDAGAWPDDCVAVRYQLLEKTYAAPGDLPGAHICIWELNDD